MSIEETVQAPGTTVLAEDNLKKVIGLGGAISISAGQIIGAGNYRSDGYRNRYDRGKVSFSPSSWLPFSPLSPVFRRPIWERPSPQPGDTTAIPAVFSLPVSDFSI